MAAMLVGGAVFGGLSGGLNAHNQQQDINNQVCQTKKKIAEYIKTSGEQYELYSTEYLNQKKQLNKLLQDINIINQNTKIAHQNFKKTYTYFLIGGITLLILLVFIFVTKKVILKETAMVK
jgi:p-aminobenzoyl-glutamate transporter AbgT